MAPTGLMAVASVVLAVCWRVSSPCVQAAASRCWTACWSTGRGGTSSGGPSSRRPWCSLSSCPAGLAHAEFDRKGPSGEASVPWVGFRPGDLDFWAQKLYA